jgi:colicin import membrane protein
VRAREAKSTERKAAEAREAEARAEAKRAREAERAKSEERKAEAKRVEAARKEAAAERARERAQAEARKSSRSRTPGGSIRTPAAQVPTGPIDSRELRASTPDLTPEQEELLALVKKQYGIPEDMSIAEIVEASRRMMAMSAKKPRGARSSSGARSSTA